MDEQKPKQELRNKSAHTYKDNINYNSPEVMKELMSGLPKNENDKIQMLSSFWLKHKIVEKKQQDFYNKRYMRSPVNRLLLKEIHELKLAYPGEIKSAASFINESIIQHIKDFRTRKTKEAQE